MFSNEGSPLSSAFVDFSPVPNPQDDDLLVFQIEDHTVISDPKPIGSQFRLFEWFGVGERILFEPLQR